MAEVATGAAIPQAPAIWPFGGGDSTPAYDPNNPETWTGDQRVNFLGEQGLKWIGGQGGNAVWQAPNGTRLPESSWFDQAFGTYDAAGKQTKAPVGVDATPVTNKEPTAPTLRYDSTGQAYEWDGTNWQPNSKFNDYTKAAGYRAPTAGPAPKSALDIEQQQVSIDAARQSIAASQQTVASAQETIQRNARLDAQAAAQQSWLTQKDMLAAANDDKRTQATVASQMATIQQQRDIYNFSIVQAQQKSYEAQQAANAAAAQFNAQGANDTARFNATGTQRAGEFNATGAERTDEFNATQGLATQQANNAAAAQKQRDIADVNDKIGVLGQDTGNRGRFASFVAANRGFGQDNTAVGQGTSLIDNSSAQPLENSLQNKQGILARPDNPYTFNPLSFNPVTFTPTTFNPVATPNYGGGPLSTFTPAQQGAPQAQTTAAGGGAAPALSGVVNPATGQGLTQAQTQQDNSQTLAAAAALGIPMLEHGGQVQGAYMSGDSSDGAENPEINIPLGNRGAMVISLKGMPPAKVKALKAKMQKFATGGLFDQLDSSPLSQQFLGDASAKFREGTPWAGQSGALPSPVYQSSPGFNPQLGSLLNSGRALEQGIPTEYSSWLANRYAPAAISDRFPIFRQATTRSL